MIDWSGYNHTAESIRPLLEPTAAGVSTCWALAWAQRLSAVVTIGYAEICTSASATAPAYVPQVPVGVADPASQTSPDGQTRAFNALITVDPDGCVLAHARKSNLYYTDAPWARPSPTGFTSADLPLESASHVSEAYTRTAFGICMDLNPRAFSAPWSDYELASHAIGTGARLLVLSAAWMESDPPTSTKEGAASAAPKDEKSAIEEERTWKAEPDVKTIEYWVSRLMPLIRREQRTIVVVANRTGRDEGEVRACDLALADGRNETAPVSRQTMAPAYGLVAKEACFVGSSCMLVLGHGRAVCLGALGKGEEGVAVIDSDAPFTSGSGDAAPQPDMEMRGMAWIPQKSQEG